MLKKNVELKNSLRLSPWRKISVGSWRLVGDSSVYGLLDINVSDIQKLLVRYNEKHHGDRLKKMTVTHLIGKALGVAVSENPDINAIVRWGKIYPRKSVDIFFHVAMDPEGRDLSGCVIRNVDQKSLPQILHELHSSVKVVKSGQDKDYKRIKSVFSTIPGFLSAPLVNLTGFILYKLNLWSPAFGVARDSFGSLMLTNIGSLGLPLAIVPLPAYAHLPLIFCMGGISDTPVAINGEVKIAPVLKCSLTFDHRLIDGVHAAKLYKSFQNYLNDIPALERELDIV